jgi:L-fuconolactonase
MRIPELVDSHHHLWRRAELPRTGILASPYLARDFPWEDLEREWDGLAVSSTVFVQVRDSDDDIAYVEDLARRHPRLGAMIAWAPLERDEAGPLLRRLRRHPIVRGVRRSTQHEPDPEFIIRPAYVAGVRLLAETGLLCELCVRHEQLAAVPRLARECPETTIVLQHLGKPDVSGPPPAGWLRGIEQLGTLPNVHCKVSVVVHRDDDRSFEAEVLAPFVRHLVDCFGWDRLLFGSNWPVSSAVVGYRAWAEMVAGILSSATERQLQALFGENARSLYGTA